MELDPNIARARKPLRAGTEGAGLRMEGPDPGIARALSRVRARGDLIRSSNILIDV